MGGGYLNSLSECTGPELDIPIPILHDLITASVKEHGPKPALICKHQPSNLIPGVGQSQTPNSNSNLPQHLRLTHTELQHSADLLAVGLLNRGLRLGSPIAVILNGRAEFHIVLRSAVKLKCPFTPIHPRSVHNEVEIRHILHLAGAKAVLVESAMVAEVLEKAVPDLLGEMQVKVMVGNERVPGTYISMSELISEALEDQTFDQQSNYLNRLPRHLDDVIFIWFTSGTTSLPKAAPHTNKSLTCNIRSWGEALSLNDTRSWLQVLPMNSIVGSSWTLAYLVCGGSITHVSYNFEVPAIAETIRGGDITDILTVPSMIDLLSFSPILAEPSNQGVDRILVGGSKILRSHVVKAFDVIKCRRFNPFFGMTEGTSVCTETLYEASSDLQAPIYAGYVVPGAKVRICAPGDTAPLPRGTAGELVQGGMQKIERYLGGQGADSFFSDNGETWYRCGDQAIMMEDGRIAIVGRYKDMIIRGGMNIAAAAVEAIISEYTHIDAQVIGIPDEAAGEVPIAVMKGSDHDETAAVRIQRCVLDRMGPPYALERVLSLGELGLDDWPKTSTGKVLKTQLQKRVLALNESSKHCSQQAPARGSGISSTDENDTEIQQTLLHCVREIGLPVSGVDDNFWSCGMDSLLALRLRNSIIKAFGSRGNLNLSPNTIFECGNVRKLTTFVKKAGLKTTTPNVENSDLDALVAEMTATVDEYSMFSRHRPEPCSKLPGKQTILLTGATGSLGAQIALHLVLLDDVQVIYCPVRGKNPSERLETALAKWSPDSAVWNQMHKIKAVAWDLNRRGLGFDEATTNMLLKGLTTIIHAAWPVNFQLPLTSFRPHLSHLQSLIQLSLDVKSPQPAQIYFCSSAGVAFSTKGQKKIIEEPIMDLRQGSSSGYTQSKLAAEYIVQRAAEDFGAYACNLRIGQIVGDTKLGLWNETEATPLMIRSALTLGCLPELDMDCSWIPVDTLAAAIIEIVTARRQTAPRLVYNMCHPRAFSWTKDLLPALASAGLQFEAISPDEWIAKVKDYSASNSIEIVTKTCPAIKLMDYWEKAYGEKAYGGKADDSTNLFFDTKMAQEDSKSISSAPDVIKSGLVKLILDAWMRSWN